jgi:hypothetical protein
LSKAEKSAFIVAEEKLTLGTQKLVDTLMDDKLLHQNFSVSKTVRACTMFQSTTTSTSVLVRHRKPGHANAT